MRSRTSAPRRLRRAFTLIEMITVCFILAMVLSAIFATFSVGNRSAEIVAQRTELYQTARIVSNRMYTELSSLWSPFPDPEAAEVQGDDGIVLPDSTGGSTQPTDDVSAATGQSDSTDTPPITGTPADSGQGLSCSIEFLTALPPQQHGDAPRTDVALVTYYVDTDPTTPEEGLLRGENRYVDLGDAEETTSFEVVSPLVTQLDITYYDPDSAEWVDTWDATTLPTAVLFSLTVDDPEDGEDPLVVTHTVTFPRQLGQELGSSFTSEEATGAEGSGGDQGASPTGEAAGGAGTDYEDLINAAAGGGAR